MFCWIPTFFSSIASVLLIGNLVLISTPTSGAKLSVFRGECVRYMRAASAKVLKNDEALKLQDLAGKGHVWLNFKNVHSASRHTFQATPSKGSFTIDIDPYEMGHGFLANPKSPKKVSIAINDLWSNSLKIALKYVIEDTRVGRKNRAAVDTYVAYFADGNDNEYRVLLHVVLPRLLFKRPYFGTKDGKLKLTVEAVSNKEKVLRSASAQLMVRELHEIAENVSNEVRVRYPVWNPLLDRSQQEEAAADRFQERMDLRIQQLEPAERVFYRIDPFDPAQYTPTHALADIRTFYSNFDETGYRSWKGVDEVAAALEPDGQITRLLSELDESTGKQDARKIARFLKGLQNDRLLVDVLAYGGLKGRSVSRSGRYLLLDVYVKDRNDVGFCYTFAIDLLGAEEPISYSHDIYWNTLDGRN